MSNHTVAKRRPMDVRIHDASIGIWQDDANDESLRSDVYAVLIHQMRKRGWSIKADPKVLKNYRSISKNHRLGELGSLRCAIEIAGRVVKVEFWSITAPQINPNGRRYDFDKLKRMASHLDQLRVELEFRRIIRWLETLAPVTTSRSDESSISPMHRIAKNYAQSWHKVKALGRPDCSYDYNRKSADGALLYQGQTVWLADRKGRMTRGVAFYNINSMWWVIVGGELRNLSCHELHTMAPADLRTKRNERGRRTRLELELAIAVQRMDFKRADVLKRVVFGVEQTFMIWARDHSAYYRSQYAGYTTDRISAGKYTREEAEAECRRVPHELEMVCPDGKHISFDRKVAA